MDAFLWRGWLPGLWPAPRPPPPPLLRATFDGNPEKLAFFLKQVWTHLDQHGGEYTEVKAQVDVVIIILEGEAAEWMTTLHDEGAPDLSDPDAFLCELRAQFSNPMQTQQVEIEVCKVKHWSRPLAKYIREFRKIAGRLRHWPE